MSSLDLELEVHIRRAHAAIGATVEEDLSFIRVRRFANGVGFNFSGSHSEEDLANSLFSAVYNVAHLQDHLKKWARRYGKDPELIRDAIRKSEPLQIVLDLSNVDKHGGAARGGGLSKKHPRLGRVSRVMQLHVGPGTQRSVVVLSLDGSSSKVEGAVDVAIVAEVVDSNGDSIGDLQDLLRKAIAAWDNLIRRLTCN